MRSQLCWCETHDRKFAWSQPLSRRFATARSVFSSDPHFQVIPKSNRIVVLTVVRTVDKGYRASARRRQDWIRRFRMSIQFGFVTFLEFTPFLRIMTEPLAQLSTGCNVLQPAIEIQGSLLYPTRPKSFYKETSAIFWRGCFVYALQFEHSGFLL